MTNPDLTFTVEDAGARLDKLIVEHLPEKSRSQIQAMIKDGLVTVDGEPVKAGIKLRGGEVVDVMLPTPAENTLEPETIDLTIVYEDDALAVIDKPSGLVVHPGAGGETGTLVHALLARYPEITQIHSDERRRGIVHRLDKDTSGLIVVARTDAAQKHLMKQFEERTVDKTYLALVERRPKTDTGRIDAPIGRDRNQRKRMAVVREGRPAVTEFRVVEDDFREGQALIEVDILTGRTHQIRVHLAFIGCPIVGDTVYGFRKQRVKLKRQFLHAHKLSFDHPTTGERLSFTSELPVGLVNVMEKMR